MLKTKLILITLFMQSLILHSQDNIVIPDVKIDSVTLFLNGAEVFRSAKVDLLKGRNVISIEGISTYVFEKSLRLSLSDDISILSIDFKRDASIVGIFPEQDSLDQLTDATTILRHELSALEEEKNLLLANNKLNKENSVADLEKLAQLYRKRLKEIDGLAYSLSKRLKIKETEFDKLLKAKELFHDNLNATNGTIRVTVDAPVNGLYALNFQCLVLNAVWKPKYALRKNGINDEPLNLEYLAYAYNNTGNDWSNIPLSFSTLDPTQDASLPYLETWFVNSKGQDWDKAKEGKLSDFKKSVKDRVGQDVKFDEIQINGADKVFRLPKNISLASEPIPKVISLQKNNLDADYKYISIPKLKQGAYYLAKITDWESLNLIEGPMNLYMNNTYLGESDINTKTVNDTLDLSLGLDKNIVVLRTKLEDNSKKLFLGFNIKETMTYEISIKNNHTNKTVLIDILDQVPVSQEKDIQINLIDLGGATLDKNTGLISWEESLEPGAVKKLVFSYSIKYPKSMKLRIEQRAYRVFSTPRYF